MMTKLPLVCICIPTYNSEKTLAKTLKSLVTQTYPNIIIKIINNNSEDNTLEIAKRYANKYNNIKIVDYSITVSAEENFDRCLELSEGKYTCLFHSDDCYEPDIIEKEIAQLETNKEVGAVFTCANIIDENDNLIGELIPRKEFFKEKMHSFPELFPLILQYGMCFVTPSAMVRTDIYKKTIKNHQRKKEFGGASDVDTWIRILKETNVIILKEKLINYRSSIASYSFRHRKDYKNTLSDKMLLVLKYNIDEMFNKEERNRYYKLLERLESKTLLKNAHEAIINKDYAYAKILLEKVNDSMLFWRYTIKKYIYISAVYFKKGKTKK